MTTNEPASKTPRGLAIWLAVILTLVAVVALFVEVTGVHAAGCFSG